MAAYSSCSLDHLVRACKETGDESAWDELVLRTQGMLAAVIGNAVRRWGVQDPPAVQDLIQETYLKIATQRGGGLQQFESQHENAILGYLRATAVSVAHDYCRSLLSRKRGSGRRAGSVSELDPPAPGDDAGGPKDIERRILLGQISRILETTDARDQEIFWLYYRQGFTAASIAAIPGFQLTTKGVESAILRLTRLVRAELVRSRLKQPSKGANLASSL